MKTIILPGYSVNNKDWANDAREKLELGHSVLVHNWQHWISGNFSLSKERSTVLNQIGAEKVNVIAKSVGTRVLMHLIPDLGGQLEKVILCGIPTKFESETPKRLYGKSLSLLSPSQVVVFQNEKDPLANYFVVEKYIHSVDLKIKVVKMEKKRPSLPLL